jgi:predicted GIY-YIG superfamily endonuclease
MPVVYVLQLRKGKMYVGYTNNYEKRMMAHFNGNGARVTQKYKPLLLKQYRVLIKSTVWPLKKK